MAAEPPNRDCPITVAVPSYNGAAHLAEAIQSILAQSDVAYELLACDDHSDDGTPDLVRILAGNRARVLHNPERLGLAGNWNRCVELSRTSLIAVFHQDDVMGPGHLADHVAAFGRDESIGLVASASEVIDQNGQPVPEGVVGRGGLGPVDRLIEPGGLAAEMAGGNPLRCSAVTIRRAAFEDVGGFDPALGYVVDWDFWLRVSRRWKVAWLASPTVRVRWHRASETHRFKTGMTDLEESAGMLDRLFSDDLRDHPERDRLRSTSTRRLARAFLNRAHEALRFGQRKLARRALGQAWRLAPREFLSFARDPRLGIQMTALAVAPALAARVFGDRAPSDPTGLSSQ